MELNLKKPVVFLDIETTGLSIVTDRIIEIGLVKIHPNGNNETKTLRINPGMEIPASSTAIHKITNEDVANKPSFKELAHSIANFLEGCDLAGYNINMFDLPLLAEEFARTEVDIDLKKHKVIDVQVIFHKMEQRTLTAAYQFFCKQELSNAHSAEADAVATFEVLKAQLDKYPGLKNDMEYLSSFSTHHNYVDFAGRLIYNAQKEEVFNFGKHKGKLVSEVLRTEPSYYGWMLDGDFPLYTKKKLTEIKLRGK
ncbi:MAG: 3'-5' exoribonuclease [Bacteroidales bacterium]|nr:3'-5' exoribonuclease [Bacteroidales bacterium]